MNYQPPDTGRFNRLKGIEARLKTELDQIAEKEGSFSRKYKRVSDRLAEVEIELYKLIKSTD